METGQILGLIIASVAYLAVTSIQHSKQIAVLQAGFQNITTQLTMINANLAAFMKTEVDTLKMLIKP